MSEFNESQSEMLEELELEDGFDDPDGEAIGVVKGPGEDISRYLVITSDNRRTKVGEFVHYYPYGNRSKSPIYGKVVSRVLARSYPAGLMADPQVGLRQMAFVLGADAEGDELYEIEVQVLGSWNKVMSCFVNPRITPDPGDHVYLTSDMELSYVLSPCGKGQLGSAHLGSLLTREEGSVPIVLRVREMVSTHLAILAGTGSGKSYTAAVLVEELLRHYNRAAILIADPHGEYSTLQEIEEQPAFCRDGYEPKVVIKPPDKIRIRMSSLKESDLRFLLPEMTDKQTHFLSVAYRNMIAEARKHGDKWGWRDLKNAVASLAENDGENQSTVNALMWKLERRFGAGSKIFSDSEHIPLTELFAPGQCTVLQLSEIESEDQQIILASILRRAFYSRLNFVNGSEQTKSETLDFPVFVLIEEAHRFAPAGGRAISTKILKTILAEGRKFGVGIGVISQRPGKLDSDVLSQCMSQLFMRIVNPVDQKSIAESVESAGRDLLRELPSLTRGQVIVAGNAIHTPVLCKVRTRLTRHGGETIDAPQEWMHYYSKNKRDDRKAESAGLADRLPPKRKKKRVI